MIHKRATLRLLIIASILLMALRIVPGFGIATLKQEGVHRGIAVSVFDGISSDNVLLNNEATDLDNEMLNDLDEDEAMLDDDNIESLEEVLKHQDPQPIELDIEEVESNSPARENSTGNTSVVNATQETQQQKTERAESETYNPIEENTNDNEKTIGGTPTAMTEDLNSYVLNIIKEYKIGNYPYLLNNDYANYNGVTKNIVFKDRILLRAHPSGNRASHCSGITFEVFYKAMVARNIAATIDKDDFNGMTYDELFDFVLTWYVASSNKKTHNIAMALEKYGVGIQITNFENAKAGDFIDFSRENNTGHTAVFLNWIRDNGRIVGLRYWSSQQSTRGINYKEEYFNIKRPNGKKYGNVIIDNVYIGRGIPIKEFRSFR